VTTDSALITASLTEPSRFGDLFRRHAGPIFRYASRRLDAGAAEDVLSETFVIAFAKRARFNHAWESALPWLFGIATREIARYRKAEARAWDAVRRDPSADIADIAEAAGDRVDAAVAVKALGAALSAMPSRDRDVLLLYAWADLDYAAIAVALDIPIGTVRSRLNRARRILRTTPGLTNSTTEGDGDDERPHPAPRLAQLRD
jgi:RNA polymerase sigma factor (sigma-70 family)